MAIAIVDDLFLACKCTYVPISVSDKIRQSWNIQVELVTLDLEGLFQTPCVLVCYRIRVVEEVL